MLVDTNVLSETVKSRPNAGVLRRLEGHSCYMLIAASALIRGVPRVTRNVSDFEGCGIALLRPFD